MKKIYCVLAALSLISTLALSEESHKSVKIVRIYADSLGESHFEDISWDMIESEFAPPAPPLLVSEFISSSTVGFIGAAPGWIGDWHPAPKRQLVIYISGRVEGAVSDGETRIFGPGDITLLDDTTGVGHRSMVIGEEQVVLAVIQLEE